MKISQHDVPMCGITVRFKSASSEDFSELRKRSVFIPDEVAAGGEVLEICEGRFKVYMVMVQTIGEREVLEIWVSKNTPVDVATPYLIAMDMTRARYDLDYQIEETEKTMNNINTRVITNSNRLHVGVAKMTAEKSMKTLRASDIFLAYIQTQLACSSIWDEMCTAGSLENWQEIAMAVRVGKIEHEEVQLDQREDSGGILKWFGLR